MRRSPIRIVLAVALGISGGAGPAISGAGPEGTFAIRGVRLLPGDGTEIPDAIVVVKDGRITDAGPTGTPVPAGIAVVDGAGGSVMPGMVLAATRLGLPREAGAREKPTPSETVAEEGPAALPVFRIGAAAGVAVAGLLPGPGCPGGEGVAVRPAAAGGSGFLVEGARVLRVDVDPSTGWVKGITGALDRGRREIEGEDRGEGKAAKPEPRTAAVREALRRRIATVVFAGSAGDADRALEVLAPYRLRLCFRVEGDAWRVAARLAGAGATVIVEPQIQNRPGSLDRVNAAAVLDAAGCPVAFALSEESRRGIEALRVQVGVLVREGLPRAAALRGLAATGARVWGLDAEEGLVAPGRPADLLLYDGDPLEPASRLRAAWSRGRAVPLGEEKP